MPAKIISTEREEQIKELVAKGKKPKQVAETLGLKLSTVSPFISRLQSSNRRTRIKEEKGLTHGFFNEHERQNWLI